MICDSVIEGSWQRPPICVSEACTKWCYECLLSLPLLLTLVSLLPLVSRVPVVTIVASVASVATVAADCHYCRNRRLCRHRRKRFLLIRLLFLACARVLLAIGCLCLLVRRATGSAAGGATGAAGGATGGCGGRGTAGGAAGAAGSGTSACCPAMSGRGNGRRRGRLLGGLGRRQRRTYCIPSMTLAPKEPLVTL